MSTRGTYRFQNDMEDVTIHVHHDSYPVGGACYLYAMLVKPSKGGMGTQFIRAIDGAEITSCHEDHGDTEFRYDIKGNGPEAHLTVSGIRGGDRDDDWTVEYLGPLHQFLTQQFRKGFPDWGQELAGCDYYEFCEVDLPFGGKRLFNRATAEKHLNSGYGPLSNIRRRRDAGDSADMLRSYEVDEVRAFVDAIPGLWTQEIEQLTGIAFV